MSSQAKMLALIGSAAILTCTHAAAYHEAETYANARVVSAQPIYETVQIPEGREVCYNEPVTYYEEAPRRRGSQTGEALGLIIGGLVGNQFGHGSGRAASTFGGAVLGSAIARDANRDRYEGGRRVTRHEEVCEWQDEYREERRLTGYDVTYDYQGATGHIVTERRPGNTVRVRVAVEAVDY